jgi:hypothetical protein
LWSIYNVNVVIYYWKEGWFCLLWEFDNSNAFAWLGTIIRACEPEKI